MKTKNKALLLTLCAVLLVTASVFGTMAYLTDQEAVVNTFSIGSISLDMDEADVKPDGTADTDNEDNDQLNERDRVKENTYHLLPGHEYTKDPTIYITANSEDAWVFVKVENDIAAYESTADNYTSIEEQIQNNGWTVLDATNYPGVYYRSHTKAGTETTYKVFQGFTIDANANNVDGWANINTTDTLVNVTGYAVQTDGFEDNPAGAWDVVMDAATQG